MHPVEHPTHRLAEARTIATEAGWPAACPEPVCRAGGRCAGRLRSVGGGARSFPTCLSVAVRMLHDRDSVTLAEADAFLGFLCPDGGWAMQPTPPAVDGWAAMDAAAADAISPDAAGLLVLLHALGAAAPSAGVD